MLSTSSTLRTETWITNVISRNSWETCNPTSKRFGKHEENGMFNQMARLGKKKVKPSLLSQARPLVAKTSAALGGKHKAAAVVAPKPAMGSYRALICGC